MRRLPSAGSVVGTTFFLITASIAVYAVAERFSTEPPPLTTAVEQVVGADQPDVALSFLNGAVNDQVVGTEPNWWLIENSTAIVLTSRVGEVVTVRLTFSMGLPPCNVEREIEVFLDGKVQRRVLSAESQPLRFEVQTSVPANGLKIVPISATGIACSVENDPRPLVAWVRDVDLLTL